MRSGWVLLLLPLLAGCSRKGEASTGDEPSVSPVLLDPEPPRATGTQRCRPETGYVPATLRARTDSNSRDASIDVGDAAPFSGGVLLTALRSSPQTEALLIASDAQGELQEIQLGRVHGPVELPRLAVSGRRAFVALSDNDASSHRLRLVRLEPAPGAESGLGGPQLHWGPDIPMARDASLVYRIAASAPSEGARGVVVFDEERDRAARSHIMGVSFLLDSLHGDMAAERISPQEHDAVEPRIVAHSEGFFVTWLRYTPPDHRKEQDRLVQQPEARIYAQRLNAAGRVLGQPVLLSEHLSVLAYEVALTQDGLLAAARDADGGGEGADFIALLRLAWDGSVTTSEVRHPELGPGAPQLLAAEAEDAWLAARGDDEQVLLGPVRAGSAQWGVELDLTGHLPLGRHLDRLFSVKPVGLDLALTLSRCAFDQ